MLSNKKGITWRMLLLGILGLVVVIFAVIMFRGGSDKSADFTKDKIDALGDCDGDNVADMFDKCNCDPEIGDEWIDSNGDGEITDSEKKCSTEDGECKCE